MNWAESDNYDFEKQEPEDPVESFAFDQGMESNEDFEQAVVLKDLLSPDARAIALGQLEGGDNPKQAVYDLAFEAIGWQRWTQAQGILLEGSPVVITQQAARQLGVNVATTNQIPRRRQGSRLRSYCQARRWGCSLLAKNSAAEPQIYLSATVQIF